MRAKQGKAVGQRGFFDFDKPLLKTTSSSPLPLQWSFNDLAVDQAVMSSIKLDLCSNWRAPRKMIDVPALKQPARAERATKFT
jgi:hypothetical protein